MKLKENEKKSGNKSLMPGYVLPHSDHLKVNGYQTGMWLCLLMRCEPLSSFCVLQGFFGKLKGL